MNWEDSMQACDVERLTEEYDLESTQFGSEIMWRFVPIQKPKAVNWYALAAGCMAWGLILLAIHKAWR